MIVDEYVDIKIGSNNAAYWKGKGYSLPSVGGRAGKNGTHLLKVKVDDLPPNSNARVNCKCLSCETVYTNRYGRARNKDHCMKCHNQMTMIGNKHGVGHSEGKGMRGERHYRFNPNLREYRKYANRVYWLTSKTYQEFEDEINPNGHVRTLCGVDGGYQLDHKLSIRDGFLQNIPEETISHKDNLQMLPWKLNRTKWFTSKEIS